MSEIVVIDDLSFEVRRSDRRTTVGLAIDRGGELVLSVPTNCPTETTRQIASDKRLWIYTKLAQRERLSRPLVAREFVTGEGFSYLGRTYRLKLIDPSGAAEPPLRLQHGRFLLLRTERHRGQEHFVRWYAHHGRPWLQHRVERLAARIGVTPPTVQVRELGYRWGSCGRGVNVHWRSILLPPRYIDYILAHELVHLCEPRHNKRFWAALARVMPDFAERKQWLAENGGRF